MDASTTDIRWVVVHSHRQPTAGACLACIYKHVPDEHARERAIAAGLGIDLEMVQQGLVSAEVAKRIRAAHPALALTRRPCGQRSTACLISTESPDARRISLRPDTLNMLKERHGEGLDQFWRNQFGYGLDCLTEVEAQNLCRQQSVVAIEDFLAQAAVEARGRGLEPAIDD